MALLTVEKPVYARTLNNGSGSVTASSNTVTLGSDTNGATVYTAGAFGGRIESLVVSTDDTVTVNLFFWILNGATVKPLGMANIPLSSGNALNVPAVDILSGSGSTLVGMLIDPNGKRYISLMANEVLRMGCLANMTAAKKAYATAQGFDFETGL